MPLRSHTATAAAISDALETASSSSVPSCAASVPLHFCSPQLIQIPDASSFAPASSIADPVPQAVLLLTPAECVPGLKRGKWWKRTQAAITSTAEAPDAPAPLVVHTAR
jgi:hypothetical protein